MIRRPPRSTRTDTLFPYTTLFRSTITHSQTSCCELPADVRSPEVRLKCETLKQRTIIRNTRGDRDNAKGYRFLHGLRFGYCPGVSRYGVGAIRAFRFRPAGWRPNSGPPRYSRSEERRVGTACVSTCISRGATNHKKKKS